MEIPEENRKEMCSAWLGGNVPWNGTFEILLAFISP